MGGDRVVESGLRTSCDPREDGRWGPQAHFRRGESLQNNHGAAALRTGPRRDRRQRDRRAFLILWRQFWSGRQVGRSSQEPEAKRQESSAPSVGQKAEVADAQEAGRKHVEQEAAQELLDRQGHQTLLVAVRGISPAKGDLVAFQGDQAVIGDRHAVGVAAEVTENVLGATEGRFAVDHPVVTEEGAEERSESLRFPEKLEVPVEAELAVGEGLPESRDKLTAENTSQHLSGEEEAVAGVDPALVIGGEATGRDDVMDMGMMFQLLIPTVEHAEKADFGAQMAGIARHFE